MRVVELSDVAESIEYGVTASASAIEVGPKFLRITDIQNGSVDWSSVPFCNADDKRLLSCRLRTGDIVFARTGATTGKSFLIRNCPENAVFASYLIRVRPSDKVDPVYLSHFFDSESYWDQISLKSAGAAQPGVNSTKLKELKIPLPPLEEQKRIAGILDQADALRRLRTRALEKLNTLGQAIFHEMFGEGIANKKMWPRLELSKLISDDDRVNYGVVQPGDHDPEGVPIIRAGDLAAPFINFETVKRISKDIDANYTRSRLKGGEILIGCVGSIGTAMIAPKEFEGANIARAVARVAIDPEKCDPEFVAEYLRSDLVQQYFQKEVRLVAQPTLNIKQIRETEIVVPPVELQRSFLLRLGVIKASKERAVESLLKQEILFAALQHRAFRGEL